MSRLWGRWRWGIAAFGELVIAGTVVVALRLLGLDKAALWATVLAPALPIATALIGWANSFRPPRGSTVDQVDQAAQELRSRILEQWREEAAHRQLLHPRPLPVRWKAVELAASDGHQHMDAIYGRTDNLESLVDAFLRLANRRLVVLGEPGSGKSALTILLTLAVARRQNRDDPIPVLLSAASWNPRRERLDDWVRRRLADDYPDLCTTDSFGATALDRLVASRRILTIVDGLDELPDSRRAEAIPAINRALVIDLPLVVVCRTAEYIAAISEAKQDVKAAAVIAPEPLQVDDVVTFLLEDASPLQRRKWQPVFDTLRDQPESAVGHALTSPLMVSMTRLVYAVPEADPIELTRFTDEGDVHDHVLSTVIPTLVQLEELKHRSPGRVGTHHWEAGKVERWLMFLAAHLERVGTRDLAWWRLERLTLPLISVLALGLICGLMFGMVPFLISEVLGVITGMSTLALAAGVAFVLAGVLSGLAIGAIDVVLGGALDEWVPSVGIDAQRTSPGSTLTDDRIISLRWAVVGSLAAGTAVGLVIELPSSHMMGLPAWFAAGIASSLMVVLTLAFVVVLTDHAWVLYISTRGWLALTRRLPLRLMTFLREAHEMGIFRQIGPVYQFRHARLQDHLARGAGVGRDFRIWRVPYLLAGESLVVQPLRPHWVSLVARVALRTAAGMLVLLLLNDLSAAAAHTQATGTLISWTEVQQHIAQRGIRLNWPDNRGLAMPASLAVLALWLTQGFLRWSTASLIVTDQRLLQERGVLLRRSRIIPLDTVLDISTSKSLLGRILNYGTVKIHADGARSWRLLCIRSPELLRDQTFVLSEQLRLGL